MKTAIEAIREMGADLVSRVPCECYTRHSKCVAPADARVLWDCVMCGEMHAFMCKHHICEIMAGRSFCKACGSPAVYRCLS